MYNVWKSISLSPTCFVASSGQRSHSLIIPSIAGASPRRLWKITETAIWQDGPVASPVEASQEQVEVFEVGFLNEVVDETGSGEKTRAPI